MEVHPPIETSLGTMLAGDVVVHIRTAVQCAPDQEATRNYQTLLELFGKLPLDIRVYSALEIIKDSTQRWQLYEEGLAVRLLREARMVAYVDYREEPREWVKFGNLSRIELGQQAQYGSWYLHGEFSSPKLVENDSQIRGWEGDYHSWEIHVDEIVVVMKNYRAHMAKIHQSA